MKNTVHVRYSWTVFEFLPRFYNSPVLGYILQERLATLWIADLFSALHHFPGGSERGFENNVYIPHIGLFMEKT